ncbi:hypothetical protein ACFSKU_04070 [Pontibacter silvestris]|uniref:Uncharacterized protein n=1 Tax=Pontibacter silvestris TaxID=2305183 RepID=A0ABW4WTF3_9BACT|nr:MULTISPECIES: hypothetical protein [Pontibacter]MCC9138973.1 hypothetical protein [Pontibacter silvestris]MCC9166351.1 hypothetical protein [Pontibacter harenae]
MDNLYDYIRQVDVRKLGAGEVSQCLLYLDYFSKKQPEMATETAYTRENLNKRVQELRQTQKHAVVWHTK